MNREQVSKLQREGLPQLQRSYKLDRGLIDRDARTAEVVASTDSPVERLFGEEILSHDDGAVDLARFNDGAAVLVNHDPDQHVGVVEQGSANVTGGKLRATLRFSTSPEGEKIFNDIKTGIRSKVSVGYRINELVLQESDGDRNVYRATSWTPHEVSVVGVPADVKAQVGRDSDVNQPVTIQLTEPMKRNFDVLRNKEEDNPGAGPAAKVEDIEAVKERARADGEREARLKYEKIEKEREEIRALATTVGMQDLAEKAIKEKRTFQEFQSSVIEEQAKRAQPVSSRPVSFAKQAHVNNGEARDLSKFSINRAIRCHLGMEHMDGVEREMVDEARNEAVRAGLQVSGLPIPQVCLFGYGQRDVTASGISEAIQTDIQGPVDFLRERLQTRQLGAQFLTGQTSNLDWPILGRGTKPTHKGEVAASDEYDWTSTALQLRPHRLPVTTELSHQLVIQSSFDAEAKTREILGFEIAAEIDNTALDGSGSGNVPEGILSTSGIGSVDASGGLTWADIIEFESDIAAANADVGSMAYLTHPTVRGTLKSTAKDSGSGQFLWEQMGNSPGDGMMNGYRAAVTTQITTAQMIFGVWSKLIIAQWGGLDLVVDNTSKADQGLLRVIAWTFYDHAVEQAAHFSAATNIP